MSPTLVKTSIPFVGNIVPRERLFARLDAALARTAVWVSGPPGAGKTTLVASYVAARKLDCVWLHVDAGDVDLGSFFHYLALAAGRGGTGAGALPKLTPEFLGGETAFARRFFRELVADRPRPALIVLDDLHAVPPDAPLHAALREGLEELANGTRAVLVSREDPPPALARLIANRVLDPLGGDELSLSRAEALAVARAHAPPGARSEELAHVCERAAGWTAGVVLLASAPRASGRAAAPSAPLFDYLAGEIFDRAKPEEQRVLLDAALLPTLPAALADRLCSSPRAEVILGELARRAYFTLRRGEREPAFELHPLFREFLLARGRSQRSPGELGRFRVRAAALLEEAGLLEPAIELSLGAESWDDAVRILLAVSPRLQATGRTMTLERWLMAIPPTLRERDPWLCYWLGQCRLPFDPDGARVHLAQAYAGFDRANDADGACLAWAGIMNGILRRWASFREMDAWIERLEEFRSRHPAPLAPDVEPFVAATFFAVLMFRRPDSPMLRELEDRAFELVVDDSAPLPVRVVLAHWLVVWCAMRGENTRAAAVVDTIAPLARADGVDPLTAISWRTAEAVHYWHVGAGSKAARAVEMGVALARDTGVHVWDLHLHIQGVNAALAQDDLGGARECLAETERALDRDNLLALSIFEHERGNIALRAGERDLALESARSVLALGRGGGMPFCEVLGNLGLALTFTAAGEMTAARPHLDEARRLGAAMRSHFAAFVCDLCEAELSSRAGDLRAAREHLARGFRTSREKHIAPDVWFSRSQLAGLCALALEGGVEADHARALVKRLALAPEGAAQALEEWPWPVQVRVFGRFEVLVRGEPFHPGTKGLPRPLDVLAAMAAIGHADADEQVVADLLWPDSEGDSAQHALETALYRLRKLLGDGIVLHRSRKIAMDARRCWVDAFALEALVARASACLARHELGGALAVTERAVRLYRGPFLAERTEAWVLGARHRLRGKLRHAIAELARHGASREGMRDLEAQACAADPAAAADARASGP